MELECPSQDRCAGLQARLPTPDEADGAAHAAQAIAAAMAPGGRVEISGDGGPSISIPPALAQLILEMLGHVASGRMVLLNPVEPLLAMHQAADILNVPRPYLDRLLASGEIPHVEIGRHRRVPLPALLAYRARRRGSENRPSMIWRGWAGTLSGSDGPAEIVSKSGGVATSIISVNA